MYNIMIVGIRLNSRRLHPSVKKLKCEVQHNGDMGMGDLWLNGLAIYDLMAGKFMT